MTDQLVPEETVVDAKYIIALLARVESYLRELPAKRNFETAEYWAGEVRLAQAFLKRFSAEYAALRSNVEAGDGPGDQPLGAKYQD